tara:strand:- start:930 stop:1250 length:321 start_codon:yes stop_codon:yes gene_type:complete
MKIKLHYNHILFRNDPEDIKKFNKGLKPFGWEITLDEDVIIDPNTINELNKWIDDFPALDEGITKFEGKEEYAKDYGIHNDYTYDKLYLEFYSLLQIITKVMEVTK